MVEEHFFAAALGVQAMSTVLAFKVAFKVVACRLLSETLLVPFKSEGAIIPTISIVVAVMVDSTRYFG